MAAPAGIALDRLLRSLFDLALMARPAPPDVMLLAAGLGRRMLPLSVLRPKPLIEVGGQALLDRVVAMACAEGLSRFVINVHAHAASMRRHVALLARRAPELSFKLSDETARLLETGGGVRKALPLIGTDPFLIMNTDAFYEPAADQPIIRMLQRYEAGSADIVLLCVQPLRQTGFRRSHDFCLAPEGIVTLDRGAPVIYAGVALIGRKVFEDTVEDAFSLNVLFDRALEAGRLAGVVLDAPWFHVGDPKALADAEARLGSVA